MNTTRKVERSYCQSQKRSVASAEIPKISVSAFVALSCVMAGWATACLFAGSLRVGGAFELLNNLVNAIIG